MRKVKIAACTGNRARVLFLPRQVCHQLDHSDRCKYMQVQISVNLLYTLWSRIYQLFTDLRTTLSISYFSPFFLQAPPLFSKSSISFLLWYFFFKKKPHCYRELEMPQKSSTGVALKNLWLGNIRRKRSSIHLNFTKKLEEFWHCQVEHCSSEEHSLRIDLWSSFFSSLCF